LLSSSLELHSASFLKGLDNIKEEYLASAEKFCRKSHLHSWVTSSCTCQRTVIFARLE